MEEAAWRSRCASNAVPNAGITRLITNDGSITADRFGIPFAPVPLHHTEVFALMMKQPVESKSFALGEARQKRRTSIIVANGE